MAMTLHEPDITARNYDETGDDFDRLVEAAGDWDLPDGGNAEVFGRNLVVSPWSKGSYHKPVKSVVRQLDRHAPEGYEVDSDPCLFVFPEYAGALGPDIWVADADLIDIDSNRLPGEALMLVGELTSPGTLGNDLHAKVDIYGRAGVPVHLLFDMRERVLTVYPDPSPKRGYQAQVSVEFGEPAHVPEPFGFELDTAAFKR